MGCSNSKSVEITSAARKKQPGTQKEEEIYILKPESSAAIYKSLMMLNNRQTAI